MSSEKQILPAALGFFLLALAAWAQNPDTIAPEESTARAKRILAQTVEAMGGPAYLSVTSRRCEGRRALIGHGGELNGYIAFKDAWVYPDEARIDYIAHGRHTLLGYLIGVQDLEMTNGGEVITLFAKNHGWVMDRGGVSDMPDSTLTQFQDTVRQSVDNLLRLRSKEPGTNFRWGGMDTVDLHPVDWVEITDANGQMIRIAIDHSTHFPVRSVTVTQDEEMGLPREDVIIYTNYLPMGGVQMPMRVSRERNGRPTAQFYYNECYPNPGLPADYFTREALEKRYKEVGGKGKPSK